MRNREPKAPAPPVDRVAAIRAAVDALLGEFYPGCRHAAFAFRPGPACPPLVVELRGDAQEVIDVDTRFGRNGRLLATVLPVDWLAKDLAGEGSR